MVTIRCEACGATYEVPDGLAGRTGKCRCGHALRVPEPGETAHHQTPQGAIMPGSYEDDELPLRAARHSESGEPVHAGVMPAASSPVGRVGARHTPTATPVVPDPHFDEGGMWVENPVRPLSEAGEAAVTSGGAGHGAHVAFGPALSDEVQPAEIVVAGSEGGALPWQVAGCPWWLQAQVDGAYLQLSVRNCGRFQGEVRVAGDGWEERIAVSSDVRPAGADALGGAWRGLSGMLLGLIVAIFFLSTIIMIPVGSAAAGALWGLRVGGRRLSGLGATATAGFALIAMLLSYAGASAAPAFVKSLGLATGNTWQHPHRDELIGAVACSLAVVIASAFSGRALGALAWRSVIAGTAGVSAAWAAAGVAALAGWFNSSAWGSDAGFALFFLTVGAASAVILGVWGTVMGAFLAPCPTADANTLPRIRPSAPRTLR